MLRECHLAEESNDEFVRICMLGDEPVENLVTWVYEEGSYVPVAKIQDGERLLSSATTWVALLRHITAMVQSSGRATMTSMVTCAIARASVISSPSAVGSV